MRLADLPTPCLVLDRSALERVVVGVVERARWLGVALRPSMAAIKSIDVARIVFRAMGHGDGESPGIAVSTLAEAEYFSSHDVADLLYTVPLTADKLEQVVKLAASGTEITVVVAGVESARAAAGARARLRVLIEVETGEGIGIAADSADFLATAKALGASLAGVIGVALAGRVEAARRHVLAAANRLVSAGHARPTVLLCGSTVLDVSTGLDGITEVTVADSLLSAPWEAAVERDQPSLTVLGSVVSHQPALPDGTRRFTIDAGATALSATVGADGAFGRVRDSAGRWPPDRASVRVLWQEQAQVMLDHPAIPAIGERVRVEPVDPALAAAGHDRFFVVDDGDEVTAVWPRVIGW